MMLGAEVAAEVRGGRVAEIDHILAMQVPCTRGHVIRRERLDQWRFPATPTAPLRMVVGVDPSDRGHGMPAASSWPA
jgi:hypothetical protein